HEHQIVEKRVVRCGDHADLPRRDNAEAHNAPGTWQKPDPYDDELERESAECGGGVKPMREMLDVPTNPRWQRAILVILVHRGEIPPLRIAAGKFDHAGFEVNAKPLPQQEEHGGAHRRLTQAQSGSKTNGCKK